MSLRSASCRDDARANLIGCMLTKYRSAEDACQALLADVEEFEILACRLWLTSYDEDGQGTVRERDATLGSATQVDVSGWERIGFDVVATDGFDTLRGGIHRFLATVQPPLFPNCYCLVDDLESAIAIAETFAASGGVEPGRYLVFDVLRDPLRGWSEDRS
jgi:hypothetical protein